MALTSAVIRSVVAGVMTWPPPHAPSCCQIIPELRCVDKYGDRGELKDEVMLCERDYGWLLREERAASPAVRHAAAPTNRTAAAAGLDMSVLRPARQLSVDELETHAAARSLVLDLSATPLADDALALLPDALPVSGKVREMLQHPERLPLGSRKCVLKLLELVDQDGTATM